jgi:hypothetical protein
MDDRLAAVMQLLEREAGRAAQAAEDDAEYTSLDGNGCNAAEVDAALDPIVRRARALAGGG